MAVNLTYGAAGIKQKDYHVYIEASDGSGVNAAYTAYVGTPSNTNLASLINALQELGELRADSISLTADDGDTENGNIVGEIVLNKACAFASELINATVENINALAGLDGVPVTVVMKEKGTGGMVVVIHNVVMRYSENITGGDIPRASISLSRNVGSVGDFRKISNIATY